MANVIITKDDIEYRIEIRVMDMSFFRYDLDFRLKGKRKWNPYVYSSEDKRLLNLAVWWDLHCVQKSILRKMFPDVDIDSVLADLRDKLAEEKKQQILKIEI